MKVGKTAKFCKNGTPPVRPANLKRAIEDLLVLNQITLEKAFPENSAAADALFQRGYEDALGEFGFAGPSQDRPELSAAYCYGYILGKYA